MGNSTFDKERFKIRIPFLVRLFVQNMRIFFSRNTNFPIFYGIFPSKNPIQYGKFCRSKEKLHIKYHKKWYFELTEKNMGNPSSR